MLDNFWNDVYGFLLKRTENENDAEDITIQTFSRAFDKIDSYKEKYKFKTWLITIAKNIHVDFLRKRKRPFLMKQLKNMKNVFMVLLTNLLPLKIKLLLSKI